MQFFVAKILQEVNIMDRLKDLKKNTKLQHDTINNIVYIGQYLCNIQSDFLVHGSIRGVEKNGRVSHYLYGIKYCVFF